MSNVSKNIIFTRGIEMALSMREKIGQRIIVGFRGTQVTGELEELIREYKVGNIILFKRNVENKAQVQKLCSDIQKLMVKYNGRKGFITIDQEGGMVVRLSEDCVNVPGAMSIGATGNTDFAYEAGRQTGKQLKNLGINFNLSPVLDVNSNKDNPVIGVRSYGDNPQTVSKFGISMIQGLKDEGIMASAKHFPGHGDTNVDSHFGLPTINKTLEELSQTDLLPFANAIESGVDAIMTAHILYPNIIEEKVPATMSEEMIEGILRGNLHFKGLVTSDCMEMQAIQKHYGTVQGVIKAFKAGVDLVFISHTMDLVRETIEELERVYESGAIPLQNLDESFNRIISYKESYLDVNVTGLDEMPNQEFVFKSLRHSLTGVNTGSAVMPPVDRDSLFIGCLPYRENDAFNLNIGQPNFPEYMGEKFECGYKIIDKDPNLQEVGEIVKSLGDHSSIVVGTYNGHMNKGQLLLVEKLLELKKPLMVIALRNPYDLQGLPSKVFGLAAYDYTWDNLKVIGDYLESPFELTGCLPVTID